MIAASSQWYCDRLKSSIDQQLAHQGPGWHTEITTWHMWCIIKGHFKRSSTLAYLHHGKQEQYGLHAMHCPQMDHWQAYQACRCETLKSIGFRAVFTILKRKYNTIQWKKQQKNKTTILQWKNVMVNTWSILHSTGSDFNLST